jgi:hypothetical protein
MELSMRVRSGRGFHGSLREIYRPEAGVLRFREHQTATAAHPLKLSVYPERFPYLRTIFLEDEIGT